MKEDGWQVGRKMGGKKKVKMKGRKEDRKEGAKNEKMDGEKKGQALWQLQVKN